MPAPTVAAMPMFAACHTVSFLGDCSSVMRCVTTAFDQFERHPFFVSQPLRATTSSVDSGQEEAAHTAAIGPRGSGRKLDAARRGLGAEWRLVGKRTGTARLGFALLLNYQPPSPIPLLARLRLGPGSAPAAPHSARPRTPAASHELGCWSLSIRSPPQRLPNGWTARREPRSCRRADA
jgi:hypothetical protein